jgi:hypothetical protein
MGTMLSSKLTMALTPRKQAVIDVLEVLASEKELDLEREREVLLCSKPTRRS